MSNEIINQAVDEATIAPVEAPKEEPQIIEEPEKKEAPVFDKKFENMKSRLKNEKRAVQYELQKTKAELDQLRNQAQPQEKPKSDGAPKEEDYEKYGEFLEAKMDWKINQGLADGYKQQQQQQVSQKEEVWKSERIEAATELADNAIATISDYQDTISEAGDLLGVLDGIPHIEKAFLESDNAPLAVYTLLKEGKLQELLTMSPARVAIEIGKAEIRGEALIKAKPVTKAPQPMSPAKGSGVSGKKPEDLNGDELRAWMRAK